MNFQLAVDGNGEFFTKIRRFIPDFKRITGNAQVTINLKDFPVDTADYHALGPFTVSGTTEKVDTRARGRAASLKIENTSQDNLGDMEHSVLTYNRMVEDNGKDNCIYTRA